MLKYPLLMVLNICLTSIEETFWTMDTIIYGIRLVVVKVLLIKNLENEANAEEGLNVLALFIHRYRWGKQIRGDERGFLEKMRVYRDLGARVYVIELEPSLQQLVGEQIYESLRINFSLRWSGDAFNQLANLFLLVLAAFRLSRRVRFNVVYAYNQDLENVLPAFVIKLLTRKPMVLIFHLFYRDYAKPFRKALSERLSKGFRLTSAFLRSSLDFLRNIAFQSADLIICVSSFVREEVIRHIRTQGVVVVRNGVNTGIFRKIECPKVYDAAFFRQAVSPERRRCSPERLEDGYGRIWRGKASLDWRRRPGARCTL